MFNTFDRTPAVGSCRRTIFLNSVAGTASPILIARAIDALSQEATTRGILLFTLGVLLLGVFGWTFNFIRQWTAARVIGDVVLKLREDVFDATIRHDMSFYDETPSGKVVSRITNDTQAFAEVASLVTNLLSQVLLVIILGVYLFLVDSWLTLVLFTMAPLAAAVALSFRQLARRVTLRARQVTAKVNAQIQESVSGIVVAKSFRQEPAIYADFDATNRESYSAGLVRGLTTSGIFPVLATLSGLGTAVLVYVGGLATRDGGLSPGDWFLFMQAVGFFWLPMISIASFWSQFQDGLSASERVFALIDAEPKVQQTAAHDAQSGERLNSIRRMSIFSYTDRGDWYCLISICDIEPGETVALVGHTGAGKSSIAKLITRFYEFQGGEILIDGHDIRDLDLGQFRPADRPGAPGTLPLLRHSAATISATAVPRPAMRRCARRRSRSAMASGWTALPEGLDTDVGERGSSLSMGQRQLVALARVVLKDPAIFILDEATASVDPFTETQIQEGLDAMMRERTAIVIAHRLSARSKTPIGSSSWTTAVSSKKAPTTSCWPTAAITPSSTTPTSATSRCPT